MRRALLALLAGTGLIGSVVGTPAASTWAGPPEQQSRVIVQGTSAEAAAAAVARAGGRVLRRLDVVDGVAAQLPSSAVLPGMVVTPDQPLRPQSLDSGGGTTATNVYRQETGATEIGGAPQRHVTVALIDTGISDVGGLGAKTLTVPDPVTGQPARCANFSSEAGDCADGYGHGTFLAGLIAGGGSYPGMDANASLVSVKIAGRSGAADTSAVLAGIQWVVSFKDQLGIKVLNLSLGTDSTHDYRKDPLNRAVERAWRAGITVVVAASNRGPATGTVSKPADDPLVITAGAVDDRGTTATSDDTVAPFSGRGPVSEGTAADPVTVAKPDLVAPGVGLVSLAVPGSHIEQTAPPSSVGVAGYRRGSGTSQATAVVSGAVALLLERRDLTPDQVKGALVTTARGMAAPVSAVGAGLINLDGAIRATATAGQVDPRQDALDGLDLSRGTARVTSFSCTQLRRALEPSAGCDVVSGELTARGRTAGPLVQPVLYAFDGVGYAGGEWTGNSWYGGQWTSGNSWYGNSWYGNSWYGNSWYGNSWYEDGSSRPTSEGTVTDYGAVLPGSSWYGVWK